MGDEIERLLVRVEANAQQFEAQMKRVNKQLWASQAANRKALEKMRADTADVGRRLGMDLNSSLKGALMGGAATIAAGFSVDAIKNFADGYTRYTNQLKVAGLEGDRLVATQEALFGTAQKYGVELEGLGSLYGKLSQSRKELKADDGDLLKFTNGVAAALKVQGGTAASTSGALTQLAQAMGGAVVRAEEFNSINEGARPILVAVATGIDRYRGSVSALRNDIINGKVSSQEFFQGFLKGSKDLEAQAEKANLTIAASFTVLNNALGKYIGEADANLSATQKLSQGIRMLAENLDILVPLVLTLAGVIGGRYVVGLAAGAVANARMFAAVVGVTAAVSRQTVAMTAAQAVALGLGRGMLAAFGGPIGLAIAAISAAVLLYQTRLSDAGSAATAMQNAHAKLDPILVQVEDHLRKAAEASGKVRDAHLAAADAAYALGEAELESSRKALIAARERLEAAKSFDGDLGVQAMTGGMPGMNSAYAELAQRDAKNRWEAEAKRLEEAGLGSIRRHKGYGAVFVPKKPSERFAEEQAAGGGGFTPAAGKDKKVKRDTGPTPEELARRKKAVDLAWELEKAQASGVATAIRAAESAQWIFQRQEQLHDQGMAWSDAEAQAIRDRIALNELEIQKAEELNAVRAADVGSDAGIVLGASDEAANALLDQEAQMRETFRTTFGDGIRAALQGDLDGYFMNLADRFSDRLIDNLSDQLFDLLNQYAKSTSGSGEGNWFNTAVSWIAKAFAGGYASGGDFGGGQWATVGEKGPEAIYAKPGGGVKVLSNGALTAMRKSAASAGEVRGGSAVYQSFDLRGAVMTQDLLRQMDQKAMMAAEVGATRGATRAARTLPGAQARTAQSRIPR